MDRKQIRRVTAFRKELLAVEKQEKKIERSALKAKPALWKTELEKRIPDKVFGGLQSAFSKGFRLVFDQGRGIIEKGYRKADIQAEHAIRDYAVDMKGNRRELKKLNKNARHADFLNLAVTTVEGIGLGALGIGMPDVVLFLGTLLKGIYETALHYGFDYESRQEQLFILKLMETAISTGEAWSRGNNQVDEMIELETVDIQDEQLHQQMDKTASVFAMDMLVLKFIQGLPVVGILGGAANPFYYGKIMKYVQLKYRKRYLLKKQDMPPLG